MVLAVKSVFHNLVPPTINLTDPDPECDLDYTPLTPKERVVHVAMNNSFGFGGHNASILCSKFTG
jgi:3-oxoacyl-[acyl-carrier-protein] synthase II